MTKLNNKYSARLLINKKQRKKLFILLTLLLYSFVIFPKNVMIIFFIISNIFFLASFLSKFFLFLIGFFIRSSRKQLLLEPSLDINLPIYSVMIPLFKEANIVEGLIYSLNQLNYPKNKLDIKLVVEEDDLETIAMIDKIELDACYHIIKVPYSSPRTKAKACNFALDYVKGKFMTIYDAEDVPEPNQLRKAVAKFALLDGKIICLQARLNYYNSNENLLTRLFSLEYLIWFDYVLPALEFLKIPIPLGGTSNHFIVEKLIELGGWDPYNVTEDAELGIRLTRAGYETSILDSITLEEAPIKISIWFTQRARWIKGYIQTYIVHMREPLNLYQLIGARSYIGMQFFFGVFAFNYIITPFALINWFYFILIDHQALFVISTISFLWKINLSTNLVNLIKFKFALRLSKFSLSTIDLLIQPFYLILISFASFKAIWQLIFRPYNWDKTMHGLTKFSKNQLFKLNKK